MKKISVIVTAYNVADEIERCLYSLHTQQMNDAEFIIVDDGSTDNTKKIIENYIRLSKDNRFIYLYKTNGGVSDARNYGLSHANGEYIWFVDGDDAIKPFDALATLYKIASQNHLDILEFNFIKRDKEQDYQGISNRHNLMNISGIRLLNEGITNKYAYPAYVWRYLYSNQFLKQIDASFKNEIYMEDELFNIISILKAKKTGYINRVFYYYYYRTNSITENKNINHRIKLVQDHLYVVNTINNYLKSINLPKKYSYDINQLIIRTYLINILKIIGYQQNISKKEIKKFINHRQLGTNNQLMKIVLLNTPNVLRNILCKLVIKIFP